MKLSKVKKLLSKEIIILFIIFLFFSLSIDLLKKTYFVSKLEHDKRQSSISYDYCEETGTGYIFYLKEKYRLNKLPQITNYGSGKKGTPPQSWIFYSNRIQDENKIIVLFNLDKSNQSRVNLSNYEIIDNYKNDCLYLKKK